ncbi:S8 family peptidase [Viridibacillus sp. YIM B01967]|uniref:S8 family peptidase n=1 Tax=Viridibacillus soli TaxID=2798301 RepID=A0ABS1H5L2_9BACL|nr:S8 family peptidase [Viridibacillus soli]MBK3494705.1 S8 family peptidase [Viridibacillus soli]
MPKIELGKYKIVSFHDDLEIIPPGVDLIKAREVWTEASEGSGVVVAVLDTGIATTHLDLADSIIDGYNFTDDDNGNPTIFEDYNGHGTHVAGIIAARKNGVGVVGIAPKSHLLILKVLNKNGAGSYEQLIEALNYAMAWTGPNGEKVSVINMSLGGPTHTNALYETVKNVYNSGIIIVAAAGNDGDGDSETYEISYPAYYEETLSIGSVNNDLIPSVFSQTNLNLKFMAPGEDVLSTHLDGRYVKLTGTSMAAPHASGAVALALNLINKYEQILLPSQIERYFNSHSKKINYPISQVGNGFIQLK